MIASWAAGQRLNFIKKAYQRNDGSYYDESLFGTWGLLLTATSITAGGGIYYHYNIFQSAFGASHWAVAGSLLLFLIAEACLVWFGLNWLRGIYNGIWKKTFTDFGIFLGMGIIVGAAGIWDYDINTRAVASINESLNTLDVRETPFTPPPSVAEYEKKIAGAQEAVRRAQASTWQGKPTGQGLDVQKANTDLIAQLEQQKSSALAFAKAEHDSLQQVKQLIVTGTAHQLADYGRYAVLAKVLFILLIPMFENKNYQVSDVRESGENGENEYEEIEETNADLDMMEPVNGLLGVGFSAIKNRMGKTPPPPGQKKRGSRVYTQFHSSAGSEEKTGKNRQIRIVGEVVEDAEKAVVELCGKIQKFYPSRWNKVADRGGKLRTMATNFRSFLNEIEEILEENPQLQLPPKWEKRVAEYQRDFLTIIEPEL